VVQGAPNQSVIAGFNRSHALEARVTMKSLALAGNWMLALVIALLAILFTSSMTRADVPVPSTNPTADDSLRNIVLPTEPGDHKLKFRTHIGDRAVVLSYLLHLPPDYADAQKRHPMLVFMHGAGECGTDLAGVYLIGPMQQLRDNPTFAATCPFIVLCPQCPPRGETWTTDYICKAVTQLVEQTIKKTRTDPDRVYATGLSMGGLGSWGITEQAPDLFAAVAPLSAMKWQEDRAGNLLKDVAVWCIVGMQDQPRFIEGTQLMEKALQQSGVTRRFTYLRDNGHDVFFPAYANPQFYEWLLAQRRPTAAQRKAMDKSPTTHPTTQPLPTAPGHYLLKFNTKIGDQPYEIDYVLYLPKDYKPESAASPAMFFLHEQDTIGPEFHDICMHGPDLALERKPALQENFPFVVISPRLPIKCDWTTPGMTQALMALLDHVSQGVKIDRSRISVTGINAGSTGAWKLADEAPDRFCAIVPVVTDNGFTPGVNRAAVIRKLPGRAMVRSTDEGYIGQMANLLTVAKLDWKLIKLPADSSALGNLPVYSDPELLKWLAQQRKR